MRLLTFTLTMAHGIGGNAFWCGFWGVAFVSLCVWEQVAGRARA